MRLYYSRSLPTGIQEGPENVVCRLALLSKKSLKSEWKMEWDGSARKEQNKLS